MNIDTKEVIRARAATLEDVQTAYREANLAQATREILEQWPTATQEQREDLERYTQKLQDQVVGSVAEVLDAEDLRTILCHVYIKLKCEWIVMNNQINYSLLCRGVHLEDTMYRAALLAQTLGPIEPLVGRDAIESIGAFLAQPLNPELQR
jgi:hypothetical protein